MGEESGRRALEDVRICDFTGQLAGAGGQRLAKFTQPRFQRAGHVRFALGERRGEILGAGNQCFADLPGAAVERGPSPGPCGRRKSGRPIS